MENQPINTPGAPLVSPTPVNQSAVSVPTKTNLILPILVTFLASGLIFGIGGYYFGRQATTSQKSTNQTELVPTSSPEPSPAASLKMYTSSFEKLTFKYPSDWKLSPIQPQSNFPQGDAIGIQDPNGKVKVTWISAIDGLGGSCDPNIPFNQTEGEMGAPCPLYEVVDKQKLANIDLYYVAYIVTRDGIKYEPTIALQDSTGLLATKRALVYLLFMGKNNGKVFAGLSGNGLIGTKAEAQAFFATSEAVQAKNILMSATY